MKIVVVFLAWWGFYVAHITNTSKAQWYQTDNINYSHFNTDLPNTGHIDTWHKDLSRLDIKGKTRYLYTYNYFINYDIISEFKHEHVNVLLTTGSILLYL